MATKGRFGVVLGASVGGLLAARVLADHFEQVVVLERDLFPPLGDQREGVPQGHHAHALLAAGHSVLERLFPGFRDDMVTLGAHPVDVLADVRWSVLGHRLDAHESDLRSLLCARPTLETYLRLRVQELRNVIVRQGCEALALIGDYRAVRGVQLRTRDDRHEYLHAELVVDATGRCSRLPGWLNQLGIESPEEERLEVDLGFASALYRRTPDALDGRLAAVICAAPPTGRSGWALAVDQQRVQVTLCGQPGDHPEPDHAAMREFARSLPDADLFALLSTAEPLSAPVALKFPYSKRVRYERLASAPRGVLAFADALCSFTPIHGQGMTVAALEAELLGKLLREGSLDLTRRFYVDAARVVDAAWWLAAGTELGSVEAHGSTARERAVDVADEPTLGARAARHYLERVCRVASVDAAAARQLVRVLQLVDSPSALLKPTLVWRALGSLSGLVRQKRPDQLLADPAVQRVFHP